MMIFFSIWEICHSIFLYLQFVTFGTFFFVVAIFPLISEGRLPLCALFSERICSDVC